ncbi:MAG: uroporphyrinogen decarboxylase [Dehalococcoidia bacterium]|nr:MAG: uroporphyrinogen decarboxylase [Dehalococcoidia bacterium]
MEAPSRFLRALARQPVDCTPVWFHRQAGRYLPGYAAIARRLSFLEMCERPEVVAEVTLEPVEAHGVDAAILFADILLVPRAMGIHLTIEREQGPIIETPIRSAEDIARLREAGAEEELGFISEAIALTRRALAGRVPLIGFAGAPFTVAAYLIDGRISAELPRTKVLMRREPALWQELLTRLTTVTVRYLLAQVRAGAQVIELFDSWAGSLTRDEWERFAAPFSRQIFQALAEAGVPTIHFAGASNHLLEAMRQAGGDAIALDWRVRLNSAWARIGYDRAVQGNLDPTVLLTPGAPLRAAIQDILDRAAGRPGHIFNLGHGVLRETSPAAVREAVALVHELSARPPAQSEEEAG